MCYFYGRSAFLKKLASLSFKERNHNTVMDFCQIYRHTQKTVRSVKK